MQGRLDEREGRFLDEVDSLFYTSEISLDMFVLYLGWLQVCH